MSGLNRVTAPAGYPVTRTQAKAHCRVSSSAEDDLIDIYLAAATGEAESQLGGWVLVEQTWDYTLDRFPACIVLPLGPVQSVERISYLDLTGAEQTLDTDLYRVDLSGRVARITPAWGEIWPSTFGVIGAVTIRMVVGYSAAVGSPPAVPSPPDYGVNIPAEIKSAVLLIIGDLYDNRANQVVGATLAKVNTAASDLLGPWALPLVGVS